MSDRASIPAPRPTGNPPLIVRVDTELHDGFQEAAVDEGLAPADFHRQALRDAVNRSRRRHGKPTLP